VSAVLAIDSSTRNAWVAVEVDGRIVARESVTAQANASSALLPAVDRAVRAAGLDVRFAGEGAELHRVALGAAFGADAVAEERSPAAGLLWLARTVPALGRVADAAAWEPEYVRAAGVERIAAAAAKGAP